MALISTRVALDGDIFEVHASGTEYPDGAREITAVPETSIIVPTRNEAGNVVQLLTRLEPVVKATHAEVIFVDDSEDSTPDIITAAGKDYARPVRLIHREPDSRQGGLGGAVLAGMTASHGHWIVVMDGDLQHPPEIVPKMLALATNDSLDLVIANRYCDGGSAESFSPVRSLTSKGSTLAAKAMFPTRLRNVDDPMTGFFLVRKSALNLAALQPNGFKILLEIVAKTPHLRIGSVPFQFGERFAGKSKASLREGARFLSLLFTLRFGTGFNRFVQFGAVGITGLIVNSALLAFWTELIGVYYMMSLLLATQGSTLWNFLLSERLVFKDSQHRDGQWQRGTMFFLMNNAALLARGPMVFYMTTLIGFNYLVSNILSMVALLIVRFALADSIIWKSRTEESSLAIAPMHGIAPEGEARS